MSAERTGALAREAGIKLSSDKAAEAIDAALKMPLQRLREAAARVPFEAEPADFLKLLRP